MLINARLDRALESIELRASKYNLVCSVITSDEPACADLGLETLQCRRDFRILKWYRKVTCMNSNDYRLSYY